MNKLIVASLLCAGLYACNDSKKETQTSKPDILATNIDSTVKPGDDFFLYANGGWIKRNPIPESESGWGIGNLVDDEIYARKRQLNEDAIKNRDKDKVSQQIADFWKSGMDSAAIDKAGITPLQNDFNTVNAITNTDQMINVIADMHRKGVGAAFGNYIAQDDKNSEQMAVIFGQGGLGMPNRDYYFNTDERTLKVKAAYRNYMLKTIKQMASANEDAQKIADDIFALETKLATASRKLADLRDPYKNYNKMSWADLAKLSGNVN